MLKKTSGVSDVEVLFISSKVKLSYDENLINSDEIKKRISKFGYEVLSEK
jgi:copper chaperone CopZ